MVLDYPQYHIFYMKGTFFVQSIATQNQSYASPFTAAGFACAGAAASILIISTLNVFTLSVLLSHVAVLTIGLLITLTVRLVRPQRREYTEQS